MENIDGNIIIIKDLIADDKWQYTSYIFDNNIWKAMNGNYNAENIYFDEDLITTTEVGNISLTNGQAVIAAAGKNLKQIFETIFVKEKNPKVTQPSVDLIFENAKSYEVGTEVEPKYTATFNNGQYEFGPDTGVKVSTWTISDNNNNILTTNNGSFNKFVVTDDTNYSITATANYTSGQMPVTNLGNNCPEAQIFENSASATKNGLVGYRKTFYGTFDNKDELTSEKIRSLNSTKNSLINGDSIEVSIPVGACRVIFAYPSDLNELDSITDTNGFGAEILSGFTKINLDVEGNNGFLAKPYNIYYIDYARANNTINSYTFTIKEEG